jgi:hypothetical protein
VNFSKKDQFDLIESTGYETYLIEKCFQLIRGTLNKIPSGTVSYNEQTNKINIGIKAGSVSGYLDDETIELLENSGVPITSSLGAVDDLIKEFSPLLFCSSYKIIDSIIEWILLNNNVVLESNEFKAKSDKVKELFESLKLPDFLEKEKEIFILPPIVKTG